MAIYPGIVKLRLRAALTTTLLGSDMSSATGLPVFYVRRPEGTVFTATGAWETVDTDGVAIVDLVNKIHRAGPGWKFTVHLPGVSNFGPRDMDVRSTIPGVPAP